MLDEGYIKFQANWTPTPPLNIPVIHHLNHWRNKMYEMGWIGAYENGIGYGNISQRLDSNGQFLISGSATGNLKKLTNAHYAKVLDFDLNKNILSCTGYTIASSESMSHAVVYQECPFVNGVIHIHHLELWKRLLHQVPTTDLKAAYGTPEMAYSIIQLLKTTDLLEQKIFVMEGHKEGIFAFGESLEEAAGVISTYFDKLFTN